MSVSSSALREHAAVVRLWRLRLDLAVPPLQRLIELLTPAERERADRFRFRVDRDRYLAGRGQLRRALGELTGTHPAALELTTGAAGKPELPGSGVWFNLAHAGGTGVLVATTGGPVGVDIERLHAVPERDLVAARFFSDLEVAALHRQPAAGRDAGFLRCWTRKEAYVKAVGAGLSMNLRSFAVSLGAGEPPEMVWATDPQEALRWSLVDLSAYVPGHVAALAVRGPAPEVHPVRGPVGGRHP